VQALPPVYTRSLLVILSLAVFSAIAWAALSKVDEVAVADGKIDAAQAGQPVRSLNGGTIQAIRVEEGQHVDQDDVLLELKSGDVQKRIKNLEEQTKKIRANQRLYEMQAIEKLKGLQNKLKFAEASIRFKEYQQFKEVDPSLVPLPDLEAAKEVESLRNQIRGKTFESRKNIQAYEQDLKRLEGEIEQAQSQADQAIMKSPVSGTVYQLKVNPGQATVQPGQDLLSILPDGATLSLKVNVLNRDIGFVSPGMKVKVKVASFPFQEFGTIDGTVVQVSPNGVTDEKLGLVFPARINLEKNAIALRGKEVKLSPGMAATGEIVMRRKSVLSFLVEPVTKRFDEAFSVR
jgi:HlyD family secretion protein